MCWSYSNRCYYIPSFFIAVFHSPNHICGHVFVPSYFCCIILKVQNAPFDDSEEKLGSLFEAIIATLGYVVTSTIGIYVITY